MKVAIIGTTAYKDHMLEHKLQLAQLGHDAKIPAFDDLKCEDEVEICDYNKSIIEWSDEVHIFWDSRSIGTLFDFGMCFALNKPIVIKYIERKTFPNVMRQYALRNRGACD